MTLKQVFHHPSDNLAALQKNEAFPLEKSDIHRPGVLNAGFELSGHRVAAVCGQEQPFMEDGLIGDLAGIVGRVEHREVDDIVLDQLKQFMAASDSKLSELHMNEKRGSRRGGRK